MVSLGISQKAVVWIVWELQIDDLNEARMFGVTERFGLPSLGDIGSPCSSSFHSFKLVCSWQVMDFCMVFY